MTFPLRKDDTERLTTADLATANRPAETAQKQNDEKRAKPVLSEDNRARIAPAGGAAIDAPSTRGKRPPAPVEATPLFPDEQLRDLQTRWDDIQTSFVDEPRSAVERADNLVAEAMQQLAEAFSRERANLEHQWDSGENISTEDLRVVFQRYRSFFSRLLSM